MLIFSNVLSWDLTGKFDWQLVLKLKVYCHFNNLAWFTSDWYCWLGFSSINSSYEMPDFDSIDRTPAKFHASESAAILNCAIVLSGSTRSYQLPHQSFAEGSLSATWASLTSNRACRPRPCPPWPLQPRWRLWFCSSQLRIRFSALFRSLPF